MRHSVEPHYGYTGWAFDYEVRGRLLQAIPSVYPDLIADHITDRFSVPSDTPISTITKGRIIGVADNGTSVQTLVVEIDGKERRDNSKRYHITWSIDRSLGAKPVDAGTVADEFFVPFETPIDIDLIPTFFAFNPRISLTHQEKLAALAFRFYQFMWWTPIPGDHYTTTRDDLELYQIVGIQNGKVYTRYCDKTKSVEVSSWDEDKFLSNDTFGCRRTWVPPHILAKK